MKAKRFNLAVESRSADFPSRLPRPVAAEPLGFELRLIDCPFLVMARAELMEIVPGKDARGVQIVEDQPHRIGADRLDPGHAAKPLAADDQAFFPPVALDFRAVAHDPEIFGGKIVGLAVLQAEAKDTAVLPQP